MADVAYYLLLALALAMFYLAGYTHGAADERRSRRERGART